MAHIWACAQGKLPSWCRDACCEENHVLKGTSLSLCCAGDITQDIRNANSQPSTWDVFSEGWQLLKMKLEAAHSCLQSCRNSLNSGGGDVALGSQYECLLASTKALFQLCITWINSVFQNTVMVWNVLNSIRWPQCMLLVFTFRKGSMFSQEDNFFCLCSVFFTRCLLWPRYRIWSQYWIWVLTLTLISSGAFVKLLDFSEPPFSHL